MKNICFGKKILSIKENNLSKIITTHYFLYVPIRRIIKVWRECQGKYIPLKEDRKLSIFCCTIEYASNVDNDKSFLVLKKFFLFYFLLFNKSEKSTKKDNDLQNYYKVIKYSLFGVPPITYNFLIKTILKPDGF